MRTDRQNGEANSRFSQFCESAQKELLGGWRGLFDDEDVVFHVCATKTWREWRYRSIHLNPGIFTPAKELHYSPKRRLVGFRASMDNLEKR